MARGNKQGGSRKSKRVSLAAANKRPMMRLRKTSAREYQFHFEEPAEQDDSPQKAASENSLDASSQVQGQEIPSRVPDASRPLMRMRVPTRRTFAFSLPHSLNRTQKNDNAYSDISETSQEDSSISFASNQYTRPKEAEKENTIPSKRRHTIASFTESFKTSSHREETNAPVIASTSTARPYENLDTPALQERRVPAARNLISKFSSTSIQETPFTNVSQKSKSPEKKRSYSYRKEDILVSENEDRPDIYASFAQSDTDLVPDSEESDVPSNSQINLVVESQNSLKSVTEKVSLAEELSLIKSQVDLIRGKSNIEQASETSNAATEVSQSSNATAESVSRKNKSNLHRNMKNIAEKKMYTEKILNTTVNSVKPKSPYSTVHRSTARSRLAENAITLLSPYNSKNIGGQMSTLRAINNLGSDVRKQNNISVHSGVQEQLSESLDSAPDSSDLEGSISHRERKTMPEAVEEQDDDADEFFRYSDLDDTQSLDTQIQPPSVKKKKFYHPTFKVDTYFKKKMLPSDLDFEVEELVSVDRKFFGSAPRKRKPNPPVQSSSNGPAITTIEDILVYKVGGKSRDMTSILDLEVALTVIHNVIKEFRENTTDSNVMDLLKKYEKSLVKDLTDVIKKAVELSITRKRNNQLERSIRELSKEVGFKIDRRIMLQSEIVALQREEEDQSTSETVSSVQTK